MSTIAIVGASTRRHKFGNKAVRGYAQSGWTVLPVHPTATEIEGIPAYASLRDITGPVDRIALYVPPEVGRTLLEDIAALEHDELFVNPGAGDAELFAEARERGLDPLDACAIVAVGVSPASL